MKKENIVPALDEGGTSDMVKVRSFNIFHAARNHSIKPPQDWTKQQQIISISTGIWSHLQVADGMDFKGKPARNVALVNATIDSIPFLKVLRGFRFVYFRAWGGSKAAKHTPQYLKPSFFLCVSATT